MDEIVKTRDAYDKIAKIYDKELWSDHPYDDQIDKFVSMVKGNNILDLGCAVGSFTKYVADKGFMVDGIDYSKNMIDIAKSKVNNATFYVMDMLDLDLNKKYDGVMAINSTIHVEKKRMQELFESIYNVLNENGVFFIILQEGDGERMVLEPFDESLAEFVSYYKTHEIEELFTKCNFEVVDKSKIIRDAEFELGHDQLVYYLKKK
ncbi:MAG: methyltransferase domain-containing protein [Bacilli bacterium]|nr:methyltransferase domain-containing protein [Bacilli bacterium]